MPTATPATSPAHTSAPLPTAPVVAAGLVGGFAVGRATHRRPLAGLVLAAAGVAAGRQWAKDCGPATTTTLVATYLAAFGLSHPLAKRIGAWPAVLTAAATSAAAAWALHDRLR
ncbi:hypothetical protein [Xylanimonas ulmi]|uniref:Uncharacterized protein n=1 Tax=Xylanimonas ulmi TaxID=228973 RepID=A0A4V2EXN6_9MICO|nr:hypothetical protein [Xylanibacterium ulmi]RZS60120.1 hypothetical protein EV386_0362 [Xylanibacterium ulmi]